MRACPQVQRLGAVALAGLLSALAPAQASDAPAAPRGPNPVAAQLERTPAPDPAALAAIRAQTHALVEALREPPAQERSLVGTVHAIEGDTLYVRAGRALVPLRLQPSTRVIGRARPTHRPGSPAARLRAQVHEGEEVRARFTIAQAPAGSGGGAAVNLATTVQPVASAPPITEVKEQQQPGPPEPPPAEAPR
ncbi:hypothetical protein FGE12_23305 [Aggregicoccus sp. 17bor-14]|uniref:hypothetical protein n=1 Tax=Myxococcaceae TaxID=31 RepID=UPI00129C5F5A|nr:MULTISPECIES: hypothetical protein [Myxococcaceae]MBF5045352.1 hypothetical protein [Simulacricoccus sp. 17bor-14]MRI91094.1 hypothetical protein [Aggregicoccus sp. 17bor-14]